MAKNVSPIIAFKVRGWFHSYAVEALRADDQSEIVGTSTSLPGAKAKLAAHAAARGWPIAEDGMSAALPESKGKSEK